MLVSCENIFVTYCQKAITSAIWRQELYYEGFYDVY